MKEARLTDQVLRLEATAHYSPASLGAIEQLLDVGKTPQELVEIYCRAECWTCRDSRGNTAREAIERAEAAREAGRRQMVRDFAHAAATDIPVLIGSDKQIAWAMSLRAGHLNNNPNSKHKKQAKASWWIEHRDEL